MSATVLLDTGPLGLLTNPRKSSSVEACANWLRALKDADCRITLPEVVDYELRREFILRNKAKALRKLDEFGAFLEYLPITTAAMRHAAELWAKARQKGRPAAGDKTIDADMILLGQALTLGASDFVVATTNVGHLTRFAPAALWHEIGVK